MHIVHVLGALDVLLGQPVLIFVEKSLQVLLAVSCNSSMSNLLCFNRMKGRILVEPFGKPNLRRSNEMPLLTEVANCSKYRRRCCSESHL